MSNSLQIFPTSPLPANIGRNRSWGESVTVYESGAQQGQTGWSRPLNRLKIPFKSVTSEDRNAVLDFVDQQKGRTIPFLMKDPDEMFVDSSGHEYTSVTTFRLFNVKSHPLIPDSAHVNIVSVLSGTLTQNIDYTLDQDTGILTYVWTPGATDSWYVSSTQFFKKWAFAADYRDVSPRVWSIYDVSIDLRELP